jgi:cytochrome c oxidase assembly protein subunit 15
MSQSPVGRGSEEIRASWLHRFAQTLAVLTFLLIAVGGLVHSHDAGLSVPDWPTTYEYNMFTFPYSKWVGGIFYEHSHRLLASAVGFLTILLAVWLTLKDRRIELKVLGWVALVCVILQGVLGGMTVLYLLPPAISTAHAGLAKIFFCLTLLIAFLTSRGWLLRDRIHLGSEKSCSVRRLNLLSLVATGAIYIQILFGAVMRHTYDNEWGFAIQGWPLSNGAWIPEFTSGVVVVHFIHRTFAFAILALAAILLLYAKKKLGDLPQLVRPAWGLLAVLVLQISLGIATVLTEWGNPAIGFYTPVITVTTTHQAVGALVLGVAFYLTLRTFQFQGSESLATEPGTEGEEDYALQV